MSSCAFIPSVLLVRSVPSHEQPHHRLVVTGRPRASSRAVVVASAVQPTGDRESAVKSRTDASLSGSRVDALVAEKDPSNPRPQPIVHKTWPPLLGALIETWKYGPTLTTVLHKKYGPMWQGEFAGTKFIIVAEHTHVMAVLRRPDLFRAALPLPGLEAILGGGGLLALDLEPHAKARRKVMPAFSSELLPHYCRPVLKRVEAFWAEIASRDISQANPVKMDTLFRKFIFEGNLILTSGIEDNVDETFQLFQTMTAGLFVRPSPLPFGPHRSSLKSCDELRLILSEEIRKKLISHADQITELRSFEESKIAANAKQGVEQGKFDLFTICLAQSELIVGDCLSTEDKERNKTDMEPVVRDMLLFWFAGYDTSSSALSGCIFELGQNPKVLERLRAEQGNLAAAIGPITIESVINSMPLLDAFVAEVMRLHPPALGAFRKVGPNGASVGGFDLEPNTPVLIDLVVPNRAANIFPNPDQLDLDRYSVEVAGKSQALLARSSLLAFGHGPHRCVAASLSPIIIKSTLSYLLRDYDFQVDPTASLKFDIVPSHAPSSGAPLVELKRRS